MAPIENKRRKFDAFAINVRRFTTPCIIYTSPCILYKSCEPSYSRVANMSFFPIIPSRALFNNLKSLILTHSVRWRLMHYSKHYQHLSEIICPPFAYLTSRISGRNFYNCQKVVNLTKDCVKMRFFLISLAYYILKKIKVLL